MHSSKDLELKAKVAKDSRGRDTVEVQLTLGDITTVGDVPAGASKGEDEAQTMPVPEALAAIHETIQPMLRGLDADLGTHEGLLTLEKAMIDKGGENFKDLGANACLPVCSMTPPALASSN